MTFLVADVNDRGDGLVVAQADGLLDQLVHRELHFEEGHVDPVRPDPHRGVLGHVENVVVHDGRVLVGEGVLGVAVGRHLGVEPPAVAVEQLLEAVGHELPDCVVDLALNIVSNTQALGNATKYSMKYSLGSQVVKKVLQNVF